MEKMYVIMSTTCTKVVYLSICLNSIEMKVEIQKEILYEINNRQAFDYTWVSINVDHHAYLEYLAILLKKYISSIVISFKLKSWSRDSCRRIESCLIVVNFGPYRYSQHLQHVEVTYGSNNIHKSYSWWCIE